MQVLAPGMQHRDGADRGAEVVRIGGHATQRLRGSAEQDAVDARLVVERDLGDLRREGKDEVEIWHLQQFGLPHVEPFSTRQPLTLRAVPVTATVVRAACQSAVAALLRVTTERSSTTGLDCCHDAPLGPSEMMGVRLTECITVVAEDIRHLQPRTHEEDSGRRRHLEPQPVERTLGAADDAGRHMRVARGRLHVGVAKQHLDDADVGPILQEVRRERVAQRMNRDPLGQSGVVTGSPAGGVKPAWIHRRPRVTTREQPVGRAFGPPVGAQDTQQLRR